MYYRGYEVCIMKKGLIIGAMVALLSISVSTVGAVSWYYVGGGQQASVFIDNDNVSKNYSTATVWLKFTHPDGTSSIEQTTFNRRSKTAQTNYIVDYDSDGNILGSGDPYEGYEPIIPGTLYDSVYKVIW